RWRQHRLVPGSGWQHLVVYTVRSVTCRRLDSFRAATGCGFATRFHRVRSLVCARLACRRWESAMLAADCAVAWSSPPLTTTGPDVRCRLTQGRRKPGARCSGMWYGACSLASTCRGASSDTSTIWPVRTVTIDDSVPLGPVC